MDDPPNPVVLVTGGVRGLGLACARRLAATGWRVHVGWRSSAERAAALEAELPGRLHRADLGDPEAAAGLVGEVVGVAGGLDALVHAVGDYEPCSYAQAEPGALRRMLLSNVETFDHVVHAARPHLRSSGRGRVVAFGTAGLAGLRARQETALYAAAKSALLVIVRSLAREEAPHGVTANLVSPGIVPHDAAHADTLDPENLSRVPAGRPTALADVAAAVGWLCSEEASHTSGTDLAVGGGWML